MNRRAMFFSPSGSTFSITFVESLDVSTLFTFGGNFRSGFVNPTGNQVGFCDSSGNQIQVCNMSTAFDLSSASFNVLKNVNNASIFGLYMSPNGAKAGTIHSSGSIRYGNLSTNYNWATQTHVGATGGPTGNYPRNGKWNGDGTAMYTHSQAIGFYLAKHNFTTPYDPSTTTGFTNQSTSFFSTADWDFLGNGNYIFTANGTFYALRPLSTAYDPTTYGDVIWSDTLENSWNIQVVDSDSSIFIFQDTTGDVYKYSYSF